MSRGHALQLIRCVVLAIASLQSGETAASKPGAVLASVPSFSIVPSLVAPISNEESDALCQASDASQEQTHAIVLLHSDYINRWRQVVERDETTEFLALSVEIARIPLHQPAEKDLRRWIGLRNILEAQLTELDSTFFEDVKRLLTDEQAAVWQGYQATTRQQQALYADPLVTEVLPRKRVIHLESMLAGNGMLDSPQLTESGILTLYTDALTALLSDLRESAIRSRQHWLKAVAETTSNNADERATMKVRVSSWMQATEGLRQISQRYQELNLETATAMGSILDPLDASVLAADVRHAMYELSFQEDRVLARFFQAACRSASPEHVDLLNPIIQSWEWQRKNSWEAMIVGRRQAIHRQVPGVADMRSGQPTVQETEFGLHDNANRSLQRKIWEMIATVFSTEEIKVYRQAALREWRPHAGESPREHVERSPPTAQQLALATAWSMDRFNELLKASHSAESHIKNAAHVWQQCASQTQTANASSTTSSLCITKLWEDANGKSVRFQDLPDFESDLCHTQVLETIHKHWVADDCLFAGLANDSEVDLIGLWQPRLARQAEWRSPIESIYRSRKGYIWWPQADEQNHLSPGAREQVALIFGSHIEPLLTIQRTQFEAEVNLWYALVVAEALKRARIDFREGPIDNSGRTVDEQIQLLGRYREEALRRVAIMKQLVFDCRRTALSHNESILADLQSKLDAAAWQVLQVSYRKQAFLKAMQWHSSCLAILASTEHASDVTHDSAETIEKLATEWIERDSACDEVAICGTDLERIKVNARRSATMLSIREFDRILHGTELAR